MSDKCQHCGAPRIADPFPYFEVYECATGFEYEGAQIRRSEFCRERELSQLRAENERLKWKVANVRTDLKLKYEAEIAKWREVVTCIRDVFGDCSSLISVEGVTLTAVGLRTVREVTDALLDDNDLTLTEPDSPKQPDSPNGENAAGSEFPAQENTEERK